MIALNKPIPAAASAKIASPVSAVVTVGATPVGLIHAVILPVDPDIKSIKILPVIPT